MKKPFIIVGLMLIALMSLSLTACGDDNDNNGASNYTEAEIIELLTGKWEVYGDVKVTVYETDETFTDSYKGNIEFKADKSVKFKITDGTKQKYSYTAIDGQTYEYEYYIEEAFIDNYNKYTILKKSGKNYISFGSSSNSYAFEIVSLTKNTFVLRIDDDIFNSDNKSKAAGHVYMTIVSN